MIEVEPDLQEIFNKSISHAEEPDPTCQNQRLNQPHVFDAPPIAAPEVRATHKRCEFGHTFQMRRWLLPRRVEVDDRQKTDFGRQEIVDSVQQGVIRRDLMISSN